MKKVFMVFVLIMTVFIFVSCGSTNVYRINIENKEKQMIEIGGGWETETDVCMNNVNTYAITNSKDHTGRGVGQSRLYVKDHSGKETVKKLDDFYASKIFCMNDGKIFIGGYTKDKGKSYSFISKYESDGTLIWGKTLILNESDSDTEFVSAITASKDAVYIASQYLEGKDGSKFWDNFIIAKLDSNGSLLWKSVEGSNNSQHDQVGAVFLDKSNQLYVSGITEGNLYGNHSGEKCSEVYSDTDYIFDIEYPCGETFIAVFSSEGKKLIQKQYPTLNEVYSMVAGDGKIAVAGSLNGNYAVQFFGADTLISVSEIIVDEARDISRCTSVGFDGENFYFAGTKMVDKSRLYTVKGRSFFNKEYSAKKRKDARSVWYETKYVSVATFVYKLKNNSQIEQLFYKTRDVAANSPKIIVEDKKVFLAGLFWIEK